MKLHPKMTSQEWKDLLDYLKANDVLLTYYPETDNDGLFMYFKYALVELPTEIGLSMKQNLKELHNKNNILWR